MRRKLFAAGLVVLGIGSLATAALALPSKNSPTQDDKAKRLFDEGLMRQQDKRFSEAITAYRRSLKIDPKQPEALNNIGFCYKSIKQFDAAVDYYKQALRLNPQLADAHEYLGEAYIGLGKKELAEKEYQALLPIDPKEAGELKEKIEAMGKGKPD